jgi:N-acetylgalactosamine-6-sulfatase
MRISRRTFLSHLTAGTAFATTRFAPAAPSSKPNILFILTDDQGWGDAKRFGHPYMLTPALDRLAREGTWFKQFYVCNPVCSPSRTAFMTGHFPARHRVHQHFASPKQNQQRGMPNWLDPDVPTVCDLLKAAGYVTAHFGKWHLCGGGVTEAPAPQDYGIDDHRICSGQRRATQWPREVRRDPFFRAKSTGYFVDETIRFIKANPGKPFYVNLWTLVPHALLRPTPQELAVYKDLRVKPADFPSYMREYVQNAKNMTAQMKVYCAAMTGLDKALGRLLDFLDDAGLAHNTLVVFTSDNGPEDYHVRNARNAGMGSPGVFRGRKRSLYEGGICTPLLARWPGKVKAGRVDAESVLAAVDFLPTVCALAGAEAPDSLRLDGEDVSDILLGAPRARSKHIYWEWRGGVAGNREYEPPRLAVREGRWKLYCNADGSRTELYDVPADPEQRRNQAVRRPAIVAKLKPKLLAWKKTLPQ